ncbi:hypothetical protein SAMN04488528_101169 [Clostridium frigidicarnis]|uniref:Uncharacterized protein n=1 Tax=Clostridium frigidicarnis TaxID=84698 RepID=A0A1I0Y6G2_9CLOT|nr:hypothetical protein SAMN04488528_101169 [Clostridium frigidicarnis]
MINFTWLDITLRILPESLLLIWCMYIFSNKRLNLYKWLISSVLICFLFTISRFMIGSYIVHVIFNIVFSTIVCIRINKINIHKAISLNIVYFLLTLIAENINFIILCSFFNLNYDEISYSRSLKTIYGLPSFIIIVIIIFLSYKFKFRKSNKNCAKFNNKDVDNYV